MPDEGRAFDPLPSGGTARRRPADAWTPVLPVPAGAPPPPEAHPSRGAPSRTWTYQDAAGAVLGHVARFDDGKGGKEFLPLTWCRHADGIRASWRWKGFPTPRPLYGLDRLAARPDAPVVLAEGEKAADAAAALLPDHVAVATPNGAAGAGKADWTPLARRRVTIWPDADAPGMDYAAAAARALHAAAAAEVRIIAPPEGVAAGWDAADALAKGWDAARAAQLAAEAQAFAEAPPTAADGGGGKGPSRADVLVGFLDRCELWHSPEHDAFATIPVRDHVENVPVVDSREFNRWLAGAYHAATGAAPGEQSLRDVVRVAEMLAVSHGPMHPVFVRVGEHAGAVYLDLGDATWRAVRVTAAGWEIVAAPPVKFLRSRAMAALPEPQAGESVERLKGLVNVAGDGDMALMVAWLITALKPRGPFPILIMNGEQGSAKSTMARLLQRLIDPSNLEARAVVRDERDLYVAAWNSWCLSFDNLSSVPDWLSDALYRISTGGGFATRQLHTDKTESIIRACRPIILNGIPDLAGRADLADRSIGVTLPAIPDDHRRTEAEFWAEFDHEHPFILGALLDAVAGALARVESVHLPRPPRMADFATWATAAEPALGWDEGAFMAAYAANRTRSTETAIENDPVARAVRDLVEFDDWQGTPTDTLERLGNFVTERERQSRLWPTVTKLKGRLRRLAAPLRHFGVVLDLDLRGGGRDNRRMIGIRRTDRQ